MTSLVLQLEDAAADRLRPRAEREGIEVTALAQRLLAEANKENPFEFDGGFSSDVLGAPGGDRFLEEHVFGRS